MFTYTYPYKTEIPAQFSCDYCGHVEEFYGGSSECLEQAKNAGWLIKKSRFDKSYNADMAEMDLWKHFCPKCF